MSDPPAPSGGGELQLVLFARLAGAGSAGRARAPQVARRAGGGPEPRVRSQPPPHLPAPPRPALRGGLGGRPPHLERGLEERRAGPGPPRQQPGTRGWSGLRPVARACLTEARGRGRRHRRCGPGPWVWPPPRVRGAPLLPVSGAPGCQPGWERAAPPPAPRRAPPPRLRRRDWRCAAEASPRTGLPPPPAPSLPLSPPGGRSRPPADPRPGAPSIGRPVGPEPASPPLFPPQVAAGPRGRQTNLCGRRPRRGLLRTRCPPPDSPGLWGSVGAPGRG